jgi:hypothetical protein
VANVLSAGDLNLLDAYWRASNYLTVGQIYLLDNPLLREPLKADHIKPRLLGHWGTSPGQNLIYVHLNRLIKRHDADVIYLSGPGHGGPAIVAQVYLEGHVLGDLSRRVAGRRRHAQALPAVLDARRYPEPRERHDTRIDPRGRRARLRARARLRRRLRQPDLIVAAVVGDGEAETGPLAGSWKGISFLNPARDGAVLPILHLNGYKIAGPTVFGRATNAEIESYLGGQGYDVLFVEGDEPSTVHGLFAAALETCYARIRDIQREARRRGVAGRPRWPCARAPHAEGMDGAQGRGRRADRGHVPRPSGAAERGQIERRASPAARGVDAQLPAGGALRWSRAARARSVGAGAGGRAADGGQPARQRRRRRGARPAELSRLRGAGRPPRDRAQRVDAPARQAHARRVHAQQAAGRFQALLS